MAGEVWRDKAGDVCAGAVGVHAQSILVQSHLQGQSRSVDDSVQPSLPNSLLILAGHLKHAVCIVLGTVPSGMTSKVQADQCQSSRRHVRGEMCQEQCC